MTTRRGFFRFLGAGAAAPVAVAVANALPEAAPVAEARPVPRANCQGGPEYDYCSMTPLHTHDMACTMAVRFDHEWQPITRKKVTLIG